MQPKNYQNKWGKTLTDIPRVMKGADLVGVEGNGIAHVVAVIRRVRCDSDDPETDPK